MPSIVSPTQTGFVKGHHIVDGIIKTQEIIHSLVLIKLLGMLIKLDLSEGYDHISWTYLF